MYAGEELDRLVATCRDKFPRHDDPVVGYDEKCSPAQLAEVESLLDVALPASHKRLLVERGPFYIAVPDYYWGHILYSPEQIVTYTLRSREVYNRDYFSDTDHELSRILNSLVFFQFVDDDREEDYYGLLCDGSPTTTVHRLKHDDVPALIDTVASDFDSHIKSLVDQIIASLP